MKNPYQSPDSTVATSAKPVGASRNLVLFVIGLICAVVAAIIPMLVTPKFRDLFISFGAELPAFTSIAINYYLALWVLPFLVITTKILLPTAKGRALMPCLIGVLGLVLIVPLVIFALYLPIFMLGSAG
nr:hypothetical protein [uncultured Pseudomonas sp.]